MDVVEELWPLPRWTQSRGEELANTISHGIGLVAALIGTPVLLLAARNAGSGGFFVGILLVLIYSWYRLRWTQQFVERERTLKAEN